MDLNSASDTYLHPQTSYRHRHLSNDDVTEGVHRVYSKGYGIFFMDDLKLLPTYLYRGCISRALTIARPRRTSIPGIQHNRQPQNGGSCNIKLRFDCIDQRNMGTPEGRGKIVGWAWLALTRSSYSEMRLICGVWSPPGRNAAPNSIDALRRIAGTWTGLHCDMAFLTMSSVFRCMLWDRVLQQ